MPKKRNDLLYNLLLHPVNFLYSLSTWTGYGSETITFDSIPIGSWTKKQFGLQPKGIIIAYGLDVERIEHTVQENEYEMIVVNARFFKPID